MTIAGCICPNQDTLLGNCPVHGIRHSFDTGKPRGPVTLAMAAQLEASGFYGVAEIARRYAIDRPRWWQRFLRGAA